MSILDSMTAAEVAEYQAEYAAWSAAHEPAPVDPEPQPTATERAWGRRCWALVDQLLGETRKAA